MTGAVLFSRHCLRHLGAHLRGLMRIRSPPQVNRTRLQSRDTCSLFGHPDKRRPDGPPLQDVAHLLHVHHRVGLLVWRGHLEQGLVAVGVELLAEGVLLLEPVPPEHLQQLVLGQLEPLEHVLEGLGLGGHLVVGHGAHGAVEDVSDLEEVLEFNRF